MHLITFPGKVLEEMFAHMQSGDMTIGSEDTASPCLLYGGGGGGPMQHWLCCSPRGKASFAKCGIYPLNPDVMCKAKIIPLSCTVWWCIQFSRV